MKAIYLMEKVITKIEEIEKENGQSITFTLNGDGSGSFEYFWESTSVLSFDTLDDLERILKL